MNNNEKKVICSLCKTRIGCQYDWYSYVGKKMQTFKHYCKSCQSKETCHIRSTKVTTEVCERCKGEKNG